jgi:hypothetical protein
MLVLCHFGTDGRHVIFVIQLPATIVKSYMHYITNLYLQGLNSFYHGPLLRSFTFNVFTFNLVIFTVVSNLMQ